MGIFSFRIKTVFVRIYFILEKTNYIVIDSISCSPPEKMALFALISLIAIFEKEKIILFTFTIFPLKFHLIDSLGYTHINSNSKKK